MKRIAKKILKNRKEKNRVEADRLEEVLQKMDDQIRNKNRKIDLQNKLVY